MRRENIIIFTDLDGTLLDPYTYSYQEAKEAMGLVKSKGIPLIFCSAKTKPEQEFYQDALKINDPFIVENGGAIFIRKDYFSFSFKSQKSFSGYNVIEIGIPYKEIRRILEQVRAETKIVVKGYGDMSVNEVALETGLDPEAARRAMQRQYGETIKLEVSEKEIKRFRKTLTRRGLKCTFGGKFYGLMGPNDKGKAVTILAELYRKERGPIRTIGIGDSLNDTSLFCAVDLPILVQKPGGVWEDINLPNLYRAKGIGPVGWNKVIMKLLQSDGWSLLYRPITRHSQSGSYVSDV